MSGDLSSGTTRNAFTGTKHILNRAAAEVDVGVARDSTFFTAAVYIMGNSATADVDFGASIHIGGNAIAATKDGTAH